MTPAQTSSPVKSASSRGPIRVLSPDRRGGEGGREARLEGGVREDRFDDEMGPGDAAELSRWLHASERCVAVLLAETTLGDRPIEVRRDPVAARLGAGTVGFVERHG